MKTILFTANTAWNLNNFRAAIIDALVQRGDRVIAVAPDDGTGKRLEERGCIFHPVRIDAKGVNPISDMRLLADLRKIYAEANPDIALHFTIKPVIYGTFAARLNRIPVLNTITGLGTAFIKQGWITSVVEMLYRRSVAGNQPVVFQNSDDLAVFQERGLVTDNPCVLVPGSGVDTEAFPRTDLPGREQVRFLLISRLLADKGIVEFADAARMIKRDYPQAQFQLLGPLGVANRTAVSEEAVESWVNEGILEYLGETADVRPAIAQASCIVLPSYREGLSRVLLEASAMGRPMITTDVPGCRDIVVDGLNGFLCKPRDSAALCEAMRRFLTLNDEQRRKIAGAARDKAVREFDSRFVVKRYVDLIDEVARPA